MVWATIIAGLLRSLGWAEGLVDAAGVIADSRAQKAKSTAEITRAHRELWAYIRSAPGSEGLFDMERDLSARPRTDVETHCVRLALVHLAWCLAEHRAGRYDLPEGLQEDVRSFMSYPARWDAWLELRRFQPRRVVNLVDRALDRTN